MPYRLLPNMTWDSGAYSPESTSTFGEESVMRNGLQIGGCIFAALLSYGVLYALSVEPRFNTLFGSGYDAFKYPKIPGYGTPNELRSFVDRNLGFDPEEFVAAIFRPAFELDRTFIRKKAWGGFDYRDVGPREPAPNMTADSTAYSRESP